MKPRILVMQFRLSDRTIFETQPVERVLQHLSCELVFKNAVAGDVDLKNPKKELAAFDCVILSGSSDLFFDGGYEETHEGRLATSKLAEEAKPFAVYLISHNIPTLGICFGHQLLGYAAGGHVGFSNVEGKTGTHVVELTDDGVHDPLMHGIPRTFAAHYGHKDVLMELPSSVVVLACHSERCRFSAVRYADRVYGVQFHPEFSRKEILTIVKKFPEYVPKGKNALELFDDTDEATLVLKNFVSLAAVSH